MDNRIEKLLTEQKSVDDVNLDAQNYVLMNNTSRPLPLNNMDTTVSQSEQADKERQASTTYRFYGSIKPVVSNALYNKNIKIYLEKELVGNTIQKVVPDNITTTFVQSPDIVEENGWLGYYDDESLESQTFDQSANQYNDNKSSLCQFIPFDPGFDRLRMLDNDGQPNYQLKLTYPAYSRDDIEIVTNGNDSVTLAKGIPIVRVTGVTFNDREYTAFETAINHGVRVGDFISLKDFTDQTGGELGLTVNQFKIFKLGDQFGDYKNRFFILDINPVNVGLNLGASAFKRVVNDIESSYYMRVFSAITTDQTDYQLFPAAFAENIYEDPEAAFNFITDVDLSPDIYRDNLGRPLSEVFLTICKLRNDASGTIQSDYWSGITNTTFWTEITPGFLTTKHERVNYNIHAFGDTNYNQQYFNVLNLSDTEFIGDIVEYNTEELEERPLVTCHHRINTEYRENRSQYTSPVLPDKKEGYIYNPHYKIKVRDFSTYIEDGSTATTIGIPDYATVSYSASSGDVVMKWRDYLDIGIYDEGGRGVDYPFESGAHYIFLGNRFYWKRQDPPCDHEFTDITLTLPGDEDELIEKLTDPKFVQILSVVPISNIGGGGTGGVTDFIPGVTPPFSVEYTIRMVKYYGDYELGPRDVPGGCVDITLISVRDVDNIC